MDATRAEGGMTAAVNTSAILLSSAPLGWPDLVIEQRYFAAAGRVVEPEGRDEHRILVWEDAISCRPRIDRQTFAIDHPHGAMVIVPAGASVEAAPEMPNRYLMLRLSGALVRSVAADLLGTPPARILPFAGAADPALSAIARFLLDAATGRQPLDAAMVAVVAREIARHLLHRYSNARSDRLGDPPGRLSYAALARVMNLIADRIATRLTVADMAREAGLSLSHFSRAFRASTGRAPHAYLLSRRVAKAAHLLHHSDRTLGQIAADCGFHDQAHLTRAIRSQFGRTPGAFRRNTGQKG